jgi:outer membrane protein, multidrug efflux system
MHIVWLLLLVGLSPSSAPAQASTFTLRDAAVYAIRHSPSLDSAQRETLISELDRRNAAAAFLPSLDLTASHGVRRNIPRTEESPWVSNLSLDLTETLYDNGQALTRHSVAKLVEEESRIRLLQTRDKLLLDLAAEFFRHGLAKKVLEVQQEQYDLLKRQFQIVESGYRQGIRTRKDYLRFRTQVNRADIELGNARNGLLKAEEEIKRLMGVPLGSGEIFQFQADESKPEQERPLELRLEQHREFRVTRLQEEAQRLQERQAHRRLWPELTLTAGASYGSASYLGTGHGFKERDGFSWNAIFGLRYNFLDWGTRSREARIESERTALRLNASETGLQALRLELSRLALDLRQLQENFRLGEELLRLEERNLELITSEYRQGKVQYLDYITSLKDFASARIGYYSSLFDLKKGVLTQKFHRGSLYEAIVGN